jgi:uncharacterized protein YeaO (DUF488 family)
MIKTKRIYEKPEDEDGIRILVYRLWPRGLTKEKVGIDLWLKDITRSTQLRKWFNHDPEKWNKFKKHYLVELNENEKSVAILKEQLTNGDVTLIIVAKDEDHNEALVLKELFSR